MKKSSRRWRKYRDVADTSKILTAVALAVSLTALYQTASENPADTMEESLEQVEVVDGDTVETANETYRLLGIDTPETYGESNPLEFGLEDTYTDRKCLKRHGRKATGFVKEKTRREDVREIRMKTDPLADERGRYGRLLTYMYTGGNTSINRKLLEKGYARLYDTRFSRREKFLEAEKSAKEQELGLWSC